MVQRAREGARFTVLYPCKLPLTQVLDSTAVTGVPGRQQVELVWTGPFDLTVRQAQYPPAVSPDPTGTTRIIVNLYSNVAATLIERNDGSGRALYHLFWKRDNMYYEVQAFGPPLQRRAILAVATSLQEYAQE
jgi:hypothetical protein